MDGQDGSTDFIRSHIRSKCEFYVSSRLSKVSYLQTFTAQGSPPVRMLDLNP